MNRGGLSCHEVTEGLNRGGLNGWFTDCEVKQRRTNPLNLRLSLKFSVYILIKVHSAPLDKRSCHEVTEGLNRGGLNGRFTDCEE